jgi:hypothetical protein
MGLMGFVSGPTALKSPLRLAAVGVAATKVEALVSRSHS